jgi:hypothetical protein
MWPEIVGENKKGVKFNESFWSEWGPSRMCFFNKSIFDDTKDIKSIYCMYEPIQSIKFNQDEIAMALTYDCADFGEHTVLFSYSDLPEIQHSGTWDFCVFEDLDTDNAELINLYSCMLLQQRGDITEEDVYKKFLEKKFQLGDEISTFSRLSGNIIKSYLKINPTVTENQAYIRFLENLYQRAKGSGNFYGVSRKILDCCKNEPENFDKVIYEIFEQNQPQQIDKNIAKESFCNIKYFLKQCKNRVNNDLNSIFINCREFFKDKVEKMEFKETDELVLDADTFQFKKTGKKINKVHFIKGKIEKTENGGVEFFEKSLYR